MVPAQLPWRQRWAGAGRRRLEDGIASLSPPGPGGEGQPGTARQPGNAGQSASHTLGDPVTPPTAVGGEIPVSDVRAVLRIPAFRRLWIALSFSSLGDWL